MKKTTVGILCIVSLFTISFFAYHHLIEPKPYRTQQEAIAALMDYPMPHILARCQKDHGYSDEDMAILERELKRYFAISLQASADNTSTGMFSSDVDNLWHSFLLFTREYAEFCHEYIGSFVHHVPEPDEEKSIEQRQAALKNFQAFIQSYETIFNEEVHPIWFLDMCGTV